RARIPAHALGGTARRPRHAPPPARCPLLRRSGGQGRRGSWRPPSSPAEGAGGTGPVYPATGGRHQSPGSGEELTQRSSAMAIRHILSLMAIIAHLVPGLPVQAQFVTLDGKDFKLDGQDFYPIAVNFTVQ